MELTGHCTDKAGNRGTGIVTFSYDTTQFVPIISYDLVLSNSTIKLGSNIFAIALTNDTGVKQVSFNWTNPAGQIKASNTHLLSANGSIDDFIVPDSLGQWRIDTQFSNDTHVALALRSKLFTVVTVGGGNGGAGGNGTSNNHAPVAVSDLITTPEDVPVSINVMANDFDPDGNSTVISFFSQAGNGTVALNPNGTLTYSPKPDFNGHDGFSYRISDGLLQSANAIVTLTITPISDPPIANAGPDQTVKEKSKTSLSGALSFDPDGEDLRYNWTLKEGPAVDLNNADTAGPSFRAPSVTKNTSLVFELTVTDGSGASSTDSVEIIVYEAGHGDDGCEGQDRHKHGDTHKHKPKDEDKHKHGDIHKHKPKGDCDDEEHDGKDKGAHDHDDGHVGNDVDDKDDDNDDEKNSNSASNDNEKEKGHAKSDGKEDNKKEKDHEENKGDENSQRKDKKDSDNNAEAIGNKSKKNERK
jgi:hypothetical protein